MHIPRIRQTAIRHSKACRNMVTALHRRVRCRISSLMAAATPLSLHSKVISAKVLQTRDIRHKLPGLTVRISRMQTEQVPGSTTIRQAGVSMVRTMRIREQVRDSTTTELRPREVRLRSSRLSEEILSHRQLLRHSSAITTISSISLNSPKIRVITDTTPHSSRSVHILHSRCRTVRKLQIRSKCLFTVRKHLQHSSRRKLSFHSRH